MLELVPQHQPFSSDYDVATCNGAADGDTIAGCNGAVCALAFQLNIRRIA